MRKNVAHLAHKQKVIGTKGVTKTMFVCHLAHKDRELAHKPEVSLRQVRQAHHRQAQAREVGSMKCNRKYVADLADQVKSLGIKALTMPILVRHMADQQRLTWRSRTT